MICKKCSAENPEEAVFCRNCGKRLDGKVNCPSCGTMNEDDSNFYIHCGAKLNGKTVCPSCNTIYEGNFCPACGTNAPAQKTAKQTKPSASLPLATETSKWVRIVEYVGGGLAMSAVFFALLFTFLIGVSSGSISGGIGSKATEVDSVCMIYEFFGSAYTDLIDTIGSSNFDASATFTMFFPVVLGTLIVTATLVTVFTLAVLSIVRYVKFVTGKSEKDYAKLSAATVIAFLTGCVSFLALNAVSSGTYSSLGIRVTSSTQFTAATVAGIVLASVFLALFAGCRIAIHAKDIYVQKRLVTLILSAVGMVLFSIALHFASVGIAKVSYTPSSATVKLGGGYQVIAAIVLMNLAQRRGGVTDYYIPDKFMIPSILAFVGMIIQIILLVMLACAIVKFLSNLTDGKETSNLKYSITATVFAVIHLVFAILACIFLIQAHDSNEAVQNATVSYAYPIVALVFAILALGVTIAHKVLLNRLRRAELSEEAETAE